MQHPTHDPELDFALCIAELIATGLIEGEYIDGELYFTLTPEGETVARALDEEYDGKS